MDHHFRQSPHWKWTSVSTDRSPVTLSARGFRFTGVSAEGNVGLRREAWVWRGMTRRCSTFARRGATRDPAATA